MENGRYEAFCIEGGRKHFYRWDLDQKIVVNDPAIDEVHFCNGTSDKSLVTVVKDGRADVPNILLQTAGKVKVYGYSVNHTRVEKIYEVKDRTKPEDYVYEETEVMRFTALDERLKRLESNGLEDIVLISLRQVTSSTGVEVLEHDYTLEQVRQFVKDGKTLLMRENGGYVYHYCGELYHDGHYVPGFTCIGQHHYGIGIYFRMLVVDEDYSVTGTYPEYAKTPNPNKLIIKNANGETIAEYDGSTKTTITI